MALFTKEESLAYHEEPRPGKLEVLPVKPCFTQKDLSMAYSPGVANACLAIADDPSLANAYTGRGNLVAVASNGTAVLGLGNIGPLAGKPVMEGKSVLFEGAQGIHLDIDHGTYPFVTSSNTVSGNAAAGSGVGPDKLDRIIGILKAYTTRVGEGPFPTELHDATGELLRTNGGEFGVTTGRPRRCGWFDAVVNRYAAQVNGLTDIVLTKLDVLTGLKEIPLCVAYDVNGARRDDMPTDQAEFAAAKPIYESMPGWDEDISQVHDFNDLPKTCQDYVKRLEELSGCRISVIGTGPQRDHIIQINSLID